MTIDCRRGASLPTSAASPTAATGVAWRLREPGTRVRVVPKSDALALRAERKQPALEDLVVARVTPGDEGWVLDLTLNYTTRPPALRRLSFQPAPDALGDEGSFSASFLFVAGPEVLPARFAFSHVQVVDVTEPNALGHALTADLAGQTATPTRLVFGDVPPDELFECVCIPGVTFEFDRSFIRPTVVDHLKRIDAVLADHPAAKLFVVGHTDRVGDELYNKRLSDRRALSTVAFITNDAATWEALYQQEGWGLRTVQVILADLGHDPGPPDGLDGPRTKKAMREFLALPDGAPVQNDAPFRARLFLAYMSGKHDVQARPDQFVGPRLGGCGEWNPLVPPNAAELANQAPGNEPNRRVVVYLFERDLPAIPCKQGDAGPCKAQLAQPGERTRYACAFYDDIARRCACEGGKKEGPPPVEPAVGKLHVRLLDTLRHEPVARRGYELASEAATFTGVTDDAGELLHEHTPPGDYTLRLEGVMEATRVIVLAPEDPEPLVRFVLTRSSGLARWEGEGRTGARAKLILEAPGLPVGTTVAFVVSQLTRAREPVLAERLEVTTTEAGRAEAEFSGWFAQERVPETVELRSIDTWPKVEFSFVATGGGVSATSAALRFSDTLFVRVSVGDEVLRLGDVTIVSPWGTQPARTDDDGVIRIDGLPPGGARVAHGRQVATPGKTS